jgi:ATP phosphoribosyltransferase
LGLRIAIPSKGRLRDPVLRLLSSAGLEPLYGPEGRVLMVPTNWENVALVYVRPEDIPAIVAGGGAELGITGLDYVEEFGGDDTGARPEPGTGKPVAAARY